VCVGGIEPDSANKKKNWPREQKLNQHPVVLVRKRLAHLLLLVLPRPIRMRFGWRLGEDHSDPLGVGDFH
jgi:hypothetical protein